LPNGHSHSTFTGFNDAGQFIGQGLIDGQEHAFIMSPEVITPEPAGAAVWTVLGIAAILSVRRVGR